jgi:hypothetical protein
MKLVNRRQTNNILFSSLIDVTPSAPPEESDHNTNDSIRRYFERLTLLETIYEKLNRESNKTPLESIDHQKLSTQSYHSNEKRMEPKEDIVNHPLIYSPNKSGNHFQKKIFFYLIIYRYK